MSALSLTSPRLDHALAIAAWGLRCVWCHSLHDGKCTCGRAGASVKPCPPSQWGKHPILAAWQKKATDDAEALRDQYVSLRCEPNIGIALGPQSNGTYVVSIDDDNAERRAALEADFGALPETLTGKSPRGEHLFFTLPSSTPLERVRNITGIGGETGVDLKAAGGQVVVVGKNAGGEYEGFLEQLADRASRAGEIVIAELPPAWTLAILAAPAPPPDVHEFQPHTLRENAHATRRYERYLDRAVAGECVLLSRTGEGQRNTATYFAAYRLLCLANGMHLPAAWAHVRDEVARAAIATGLSEGESRATVASAEKAVIDGGRVRTPRPLPWSSRVVTNGAHANGAHANGAVALHSHAHSHAHSRALGEHEPAPTSSPPLSLVSLSSSASSAASSSALEEHGAIALIEDNGAPAKIAANVARMLACHPRGTPRFDVFKNRVVWPDTGEEITDHDELQIQAWLVAKPHSQRVRAAVDVVHGGVRLAASVRPFHPIQDYLRGLRWDLTSRVDAFGSTYLGAPDTPYHRAIAACFFVGAVARAMVPGCQLDTMLVLEGEQGVRKTSALRTLAGASWFSNTPIDLRKAPDKFQQLDGVWIYEMGELDSQSRHVDPGAIKAYISLREDRYRPSFGRNVITRTRTVAFAASTNATTYLSDDTGGRRFHCMPCMCVRLDEIARDRDQLWAEAFSLYTRGEAWWLADDLDAVARAEVDARYQGDTWEEALPRLLVSHQRITSSGALALLGVELGKQSRGDAMRVGAALRRLGWVRQRTRTEGSRAYEYVNTRLK